jgi:hypothetical protein
MGAHFPTEQLQTGAIVDYLLIRDKISPAHFFVPLRAD